MAVAMPGTRARSLSRGKRLERTLRLVQQSHHALLRATDETALLQAVCETAVEIGGYRFSWIGRAEQDEARTIKPVASAGDGQGYLDSVSITWSDTPSGRGPSGLSIRTRTAFWTRDVASDPRMAPWREAALQRGFLSSIALPMLTDDGVFGALTMYAGTTDAFDDDAPACWRGRATGCCRP
jgi:GAF domain-containing protein